MRFLLASPSLAPVRCLAPTWPSVQMCDVHAPSPSQLPRNLHRLASALRAVDERERLLRIMRLGESLPLAPITELGPHTRVPGCVSVVHLLAELGEGDELRLAGRADSRLARGLVALLVRGLRGERAETVRRLNVRELAEAAGLPRLLTPGRLNGMEGMLRVVVSQLDAAAAPVVAPPPAESGMSATEASAEALPTHTADETARAKDWASAMPQPRLVWPAAEEEVALLLSGGVDSSVALHELLRAGHRVRAFYLRIWLEDEQAHAARGACPWEEDWAYCQEVCRQAGVPLEAVSLQREYQEHVVGYLVAEAAAGRTPNPDIMCNSRIKFGVFHERIGVHFAQVASGHYAQTAPHPTEEGKVQLLRSMDAHKDQTYFLSQLRQEQLRTATFPIGGMSKPAVREAAHRLHLPNRARKDSQGICFLGQLNYDDFLRDHLGEAPGPVIDYETGATIGTHRGLWFHTVGQRRGLGPILDNAHRALGPWHVVCKDFEANTLHATRHYSSAEKARNHFRADAINWVAGAAPAAGLGGAPLELQVKVRHGEECHAAEVTLDEEGMQAHVQLAKRDKGLAPGQYAAFYDGDACLGSGVITEGAV